MKNQESKAIWTDGAETEEWNDSRNWDTQQVPSTKAIFSKSKKTLITFSTLETAKIDEIEFTPEAPSFTFLFGSTPSKPALTIEGYGIVNHSKVAQSFVVAGTGANFKFPQLKFANNATAGGHEMSYHSGPESLENGYGGGIIGFADHATAGSANFVVRTGKQAPPKTERSTVGGEVSFSDYSTAENASFIIYGSLGIDGDTFGNTVFHDNSTAAHAKFTNIGGTVAGGDGGNTQFYGSSNAAHGLFHNYGGTFYKANGGDVAFDGIADGGNAHFHNYPATVQGGNGGVTSFNNNPPVMGQQGASAGHAFYHNYGATTEKTGGGGHTEFTAKYGCPTGAKANFINYGSMISGKSSAGHTIFSINLPTDNFPTAGHGTYRNQPAEASGGAPGFTEFAVYVDKDAITPNGPDLMAEHPKDKVPTAGKGTFLNFGGSIPGAEGGLTSLAGIASAGDALLIAYGGLNGGKGGKISFSNQAQGGNAKIQLFGNGTLDLGWLSQNISIGSLELAGGILLMELGRKDVMLQVSEDLIMHSSEMNFEFYPVKGEVIDPSKWYKVLSAPNLGTFQANQFSGNEIGGVTPCFKIEGEQLLVNYKS